MVSTKNPNYPLHKSRKPEVVRQDMSNASMFFFSKRSATSHFDRVKRIASERRVSLDELSLTAGGTRGLVLFFSGYRVVLVLEL